jgi:hypothetical protein
MTASETAISRDKTQPATTRVAREELEILPLPWPAPGVDSRTARRQHGHRCVNCPSYYLCTGPDDTGECVPLCGPCLWVELGEQLRMYRSMAEAIDRRRRKLEERVGSSACRRARMLRRNLLRQSNNVVAGFGRVVLKREERGSNVRDRS